MSTGDRLLRSCLEGMPTGPEYDYEGWGRQAVYLLVVGFFAWGICLGLYRGMYCYQHPLHEHLIDT